MSNIEGMPQAAAQGAPSDPYTIVPALLCIAKSTRAFNTLSLAEIGLHPGQDQLLDRLDPEHPVTVSTLAEDLGVRPSTVSKMLDRLVEKALVERCASSADARQTMVRLLPTGEKAKAAVHQIWKRMDEYITDSLSHEELGAIRSSLERTDDILSTRLRRLR
ncbi:MarR family winged helix-turn-helix transcriptional regulator [Jiella sp. M17.18]|uniref:MarR family winged helix-turn-helix transcriptional regulator n=1 Tax=Jiella sp. M17.18 TaxID=3234247 RepID=UPI0034DE489E